jgi:peptide/nickel transport system permease protein
MNNTTQSLTVIALHKFKRIFWGVFSFMFIILSWFYLCLCISLIIQKNQMHLSIHSKPPGFNVNMLSIPLEEETRKDVE